MQIRVVKNYTFSCIFNNTKKLIPQCKNLVIGYANQIDTLEFDAIVNKVLDEFRGLVFTSVEIEEYEYLEQLDSLGIIGMAIVDYVDYDNNYLIESIEAELISELNTSEDSIKVQLF